MQKPWRVGVIVVVGVFATGLWWWQQNGEHDDLITAAVKRDTVTEEVSVSGFVEADNTADLSFPTAGRVSQVYVEEGDKVEAGTLLATVGQEQLAAERQRALAALRQAEAARDELINGQTTEERAVTEATVAQARSAYTQTVATELQKIENAQIALRSNDLVAYAKDPEEEATAPTVTGSYTCNDEGEYTLELYRSDTDSGYSYAYEGLESGRSVASVDQPVPLGDCGLSLTFTDGESYADSEWTILVPNTRSSSYATYRNALTLAEQQAEQNIAAAKDALALAEDTATRETAAPRVEALLSANAAVTAAQADLAQIDARLGDQSIYAPFAGMITDVDRLPGEIATTEPFITLVAEDAFTLIARIPEIDITKVDIGQSVTAIFDAKSDEPLPGSVTFVSPIATEIEGVAYFETKIALAESPTWLRAGLNADINVRIDQRTDVPVIPLRFVEQTPDGSFVTVFAEGASRRRAVETGLRGTDGMVEVTNLSPGTVVVAP